MAAHRRDSEHTETGNRNHIHIEIQLYVAMAVLRFCCDFSICCITLLNKSQCNVRYLQVSKSVGKQI